MPKYKRKKYYNVRLYGEEQVYQFEDCRDAATWLVEEGWSKTINAARVGLSTVLTGKYTAYRRFKITARRYY